MMDATFTHLHADEVERRRTASVAALAEIERQRFADWYQERCDQIYWTRGQCCAGCDHWASDGGLTGTCAAAGIVSGEDVLRSFGVEWSTRTPPPGFPYTQAEFACGKFRDDFDWSTLDHEYLARIGAMRFGAVKAKPTTVATPSPQEGGDGG